MVTDEWNERNRMTKTLDNQVQFINAGGAAVTRPGFVPPSPWEELEAVRVAHERALEEHVSEQARRQDARSQERQLQEHLKAVQESQRQARQEATKAVKGAAIAALQVVAERGEEWLAQIAEERAVALAEAAEHRAALEAAEARAHSNDAIEAWLRQALSDTSPQPFDVVAERVAS